MMADKNTKARTEPHGTANQIVLWNQWIYKTKFFIAMNSLEAIAVTLPTVQVK